MEKCGEKNAKEEEEDNQEEEYQKEDYKEEGYQEKEDHKEENDKEKEEHKKEKKEINALRNKGPKFGPLTQIWGGGHFYFFDPRGKPIF
ncbi:MAG: hypothetical protein JSV56_00900 [Methanomassiliicoccales archaeon]|nr:MAG: hypothetical protein JSV56_00900 [Methanomassiliicoccales archaeon]